MTKEIQSFRIFNSFSRLDQVHSFDSGDFCKNFTDISRLRSDNLCGFARFLARNLCDASFSVIFL